MDPIEGRVHSSQQTDRCVFGMCYAYGVFNANASREQAKTEW